MVIGNSKDESPKIKQPNKRHKASRDSSYMQEGEKKTSKITMLNVTYHSRELFRGQNDLKSFGIEEDE